MITVQASLRQFFHPHINMHILSAALWKLGGKTYSAIDINIYCKSGIYC